MFRLQTISKKLLCCSFPQPCLNLTSTKSLLQFTYHGPDPDIRQLRLHSQGASLANIYDPYSGKVVVSESVVQSYKKEKQKKNQIFSTKSLVKFWSVNSSVKAWSMSRTELSTIVAVALLCPSSPVLHLNSVDSMQLNWSILASDSNCWETSVSKLTLLCFTGSSVLLQTYGGGALVAPEEWWVYTKVVSPLTRWLWQGQ